MATAGKWLSIVGTVLAFICTGLQGWDKLRPHPSPVPVVPGISIPTAVPAKPGVPEFIKATTSAKRVDWITPDSGLTIVGHDRLNDTTEAIVIAAAPGQYRLMALAADGTAPIHSEWCVITVTGAQPPPVPPQPTPVPPSPQPVPPQPTPRKAAKLNITTIDDATARSADLTAVLTSPVIQQIRGKGHSFNIRNSTNEAAKTYASQIQANGGLPVIVILDDQTSKQLNTDPMDMRIPKDLASLKALLLKFTDNL